MSQSYASTATLAVMRNALGDDSLKWKERPLPSYVARRFSTTLAGQMGMSARLRGGLGNWRNATDKDAKDESVSMAIRYDASKTQANLQAKLMRAHALHRAVAKVNSFNIALRELTPHFPPLADVEAWAIDLVNRRPPTGRRRSIPP